MSQEGRREHFLAGLGQIIEFADSRRMCYHLNLKANSDSVPCSATKQNKHLGHPSR